jgi:hypothetical protein
MSLPLTKLILFFLGFTLEGSAERSRAQANTRLTRKCKVVAIDIGDAEKGSGPSDYCVMKHERQHNT